MGLYIPDLRLPADDDFELWIAVKKDGSFTYNVSGGWHDGKQKAIPVPELHGRLIDADVLVNDYPRIWSTYDLRRIANAPAIIPASEED